MEYQGVVIRPPSEARSLILQVTHGCSNNKCTFCPTYKGTRFRIKDQQQIEAEIDEVSSLFPYRRVFLADGDALIIPQPRLTAIMARLSNKIRGLERVGIYGNAKSILRKSVDDLCELKRLGLGIIYLGLESGDPQVLDAIKKGVAPKQMIEAAQRVKQSGILLSVTVLLGIAGKDGGERHARLTAEVLNSMQPDYVGALTLMVVPGSPLYEQMLDNSFKMPGVFEMLGELRTMLAGLELNNCLFTSNHASNYLPLKVRLPAQKAHALQMIDEVIDSGDQRRLRPEFLRAL
ncbi:MAG: radical SAM protein [Candidatus Alcyoniella australis]|nr:radical SAM protein [Candidatus Alcyoniella australis]